MDSPLTYEIQAPLLKKRIFFYVNDFYVILHWSWEFSQLAL